MKANLNKQVMALLLAIFIDSLGWGVVYPVFSPLFINNTTNLFAGTVSLSTRNFWFEFIIAIYCVFMFLASPVLGSLSDRYGRKIILTISLLGNSLGFVISAIGITLNSIVVIVLGRILAGATAGSLTIAQAALMDISEPSQKALRLSWIGLANGIGFACGPILGGLMLDQSIWGGIHYQTAFCITAGLAFIAALFINHSFTETFKGNKAQKIDFMIGINNIFESFRSNIKFYCGVMLFFMLSWNMFFNEIPIVLGEKFLLSGALIGYFMAYVSAIFTISMLAILPWFLKKVSLERLILLSLIIQVISQVLFSLSPHLIWVYLLVIPLVIAVPFSYVGIITQVSNLTDKNHQGKAMGVIGSIVAFTWGLGPIMTGLLAKANFLAPYLLSIFSVIIAVFIFHKRERAI